VQLKLPRGAVDVSVHLQESGYVARTVLGVQVTADPEPAPIVVDLQRGVELELEVSGDAAFDRAVREGHVLFVLEQAQVPLVRGPFAEQGGESNHRVGGVNLWFEQPGLLQQMPDFGDGGIAKLGGLAPGRYTMKAFPDDFVFEPASFDVAAGGSKVTLRWRRR
jgi:hypothetical protein